MKKRKNILLIVFSLLLLAVTVYALMSGGDSLDTSAGNHNPGLLEEALGMINESFTTNKR